MKYQMELIKTKEDRDSILQAATDGRNEASYQQYMLEKKIANAFEQVKQIDHELEDHTKQNEMLKASIEGLQPSAIKLKMEVVQKSIQYKMCRLEASREPYKPAITLLKILELECVNKRINEFDAFLTQVNKITL